MPYESAVAVFPAARRFFACWQANAVSAASRPPEGKGAVDAAQDVHQKWESKMVATLPKDGWSLTETQLRLAIADIQQQRGRNR